MNSICVLALAAVLQTPPAEKQAERPLDIQVGVVAYEDFRDEFERAEKLLGELAAAHKAPLRFKLAAGTYGDVAHWLRHGMVDIAVVTPGLLAETFDGEADGDGVRLARYLATVGKRAATSKWARDERKKPGYYDRYRSVCVVANGSAIKSADDFKLAVAAGKVRFLCVHPSSVSSRIAPAFALKQMGLELREDQIEYTDSHSASLRRLVNPVQSGGEGDVKEGVGELVAFLWDDAERGLTELAKGVRAISLPELDRLEIPSDAVVARAGFSEAPLVEKLLLAHTDAEGRHDFLRPNDWQQHYEPVRRWMSAAGAMEAADSQRISLDEIGRLLLHHARSQPVPPRLALVLSSGGAKCSYQVGAVAALEEKLAELRKSNPAEQLDIALVVGTSGGAINSVPIALGITTTADGRDDFLDVWAKLDQRKIVRPAIIVRANIGLWFALLQTAIVAWIVHRWVRRPEMRGWMFGGLFAALAFVEIVIGSLDVAPWSMLGKNHLLHHAWLWMTFGIDASAWSVLAVGLVVLARQWMVVRRGEYLPMSTRRVNRILAAGLIFLPIVQLITVLFYQQTLSGGQGLEQTVAKLFPELIDRHLVRTGKKPLTIDETASDKLRMKSVSRQLITRRLLTRDLVLAGTCLEQSTPSLPADLYFYAAAGGASAAPPFGARGISLVQHEGLTLDAMLGSGSIFPVFPPRRLEDFPRSGEFAELVDGAFAHYSPIEAAVLWGATHIVVIEASPRKRPERDNFLQNGLAALGHLYDQSQAVDTRSHGKVAIFTLAPDPPHICLLDFSDNLIRDAAKKGYRDAVGRSSAKSGGGGDGKRGSRFQKELGEPLFREISLPGE